jgi:hypothetical protein
MTRPTYCDLGEGTARARQSSALGRVREHGDHPSPVLAQLAMLGGGVRDSSPGIEGVAELERAGLTDLPQMALVFAAAADVRTGRGQVGTARHEVKRAQILLAALGDGAASWYQLENRVLHARACLRLSDVPRARTLLAEAERFMRRTPDSEVLAELLGDVRARADAFLASSVRSSSC